MRLLNTKTLQLESFLDEKKPPYAILSHTWEEGEVLFEDAVGGPKELLECDKQGLKKVLKSSKRAKREGLAYIWIDTCCIDKSSSAELSEAINSMFRWYHESEICYVFLADYQQGAGQPLSTCRWFTRGWTLQELIAPSRVDFYDSRWTKFGDREGLSSDLAKITKIDELVLSRFQRKVGAKDPLVDDLRSYCVSEKMSWASNRVTTRKEDVAYSLLGLFGVNMPLLYGEGEMAFARLQQEIAKNSHDQTILTWGGSASRGLMFAKHPSSFENGGIFRQAAGISDHMTISAGNSGVDIDVYLAPCTLLLFASEHDDPSKHELTAAVLSCGLKSNNFKCAAILVRRTPVSANSFDRFTGTRPFFVEPGRKIFDIRYHHGGPRRPHQVVLDPSELTRARISLQYYRFETVALQQGLLGAGYTPQASVVFSSGSSDLLIERACPEGFTPIPIALMDPCILPALVYTNSADEDLWAYGAVSFSHPVDNGFFLLWGFVGPLIELDWTFQESMPFCVLCRHDLGSRGGKPAMSRLGEDEEEDGKWIRHLVDRVRKAGGQDSPMSRACTGDELSTTGLRRSWVNDRRHIVSVVIKLLQVDFLGRRQVKICMDFDIK